MHSSGFWIILDSNLKKTQRLHGLILEINEPMAGSPPDSILVLLICMQLKQHFLPVSPEFSSGQPLNHCCITSAVNTEFAGEGGNKHITLLEVRMDVA